MKQRTHCRFGLRFFSKSYRFLSFSIRIFLIGAGAKKRRKRSTPCFSFNMPHTCNKCKSHVETRYHCTVCDDFNLCVNCKVKDGHPHPMEKLGFPSDYGSLPTGARRCLEMLVKHIVTCRNAKCHLPEPMSLGCQKMKQMMKGGMIHLKHCRRRTVDNCPICKQLIDLLFVEEKKTLSIRVPGQVRDEAATIAATMTVTVTSTSSQSAGPQTVDKQFALSKPEHQQLMQIQAETPSQWNKKVYQIFKGNSSFMAAFNSEFGQYGGGIGDLLGPN